MASITYADPIMSHGNDRASSLSHHGRPLKGILKKPREQPVRQQPGGHCEPSTAVDFKDSFMAHYLEEMSWMVDSVEGYKQACWYHHYPADRHDKSTKVSFAERRTVKLYLTENPMVATDYARHDPHHRRVTVDEYTDDDLSLLAYGLENTSAAGHVQDAGLADDWAASREGIYDTAAAPVIDYLDTLPWKPIPIEWELDFELSRCQAVESESSDGEPELLDTDSDYSTDDVSDRDCPPTPVLAIFDIVDLEFSSARWDDMMDEDAESTELSLLAPKEPRKSVSPIHIFDGLGASLRGRSWEELLVEDEAVQEESTARPVPRQQQDVIANKLELFDGLGSGLKGMRWDDMVEDEDEQIAAARPECLSQAGGCLAGLFDGLGSGLKGPRWDDMVEEDLALGRSASTLDSAICSGPGGIFIFDGLGRGIKGRRWADQLDED